MGVNCKQNENEQVPAAFNDTSEGDCTLRRAQELLVKDQRLRGALAQAQTARLVLAAATPTPRDEYGYGKLGREMIVRRSIEPRK